MATFLPNWFLISPSLKASGHSSLMMEKSCLIPILRFPFRRRGVAESKWFGEVQGRREVSNDVKTGVILALSAEARSGPFFYQAP